VKRVHVQYYFNGKDHVNVITHNSEVESEIKILLSQFLWCDPDEIRIHRIWSE
jgi:hypothetical protein